MKYYIVAGEASGDLHAAELMKEIKQADKDAQFRYWGGSNMQREGGTLVRHYKDTAYMGFITVAMNIKKILANIAYCKRDITEWQPDTLILVDYAGFNLRIAKYISENTNISIQYYIPPKLWAWKEGRINQIKRFVDKVYCILPFEKDYFKQKHNYNVSYVGNPTLNEVEHFKQNEAISKEEFMQKHYIDDRPIIAIMCGSRKQEIDNNLPIMLRSAGRFRNYQVVIAGAPSIEPNYYNKYTDNSCAKIIFNDTYNLLNNSCMAMVTSGTATLETAIFNVPQVVCYYMSFGWLVNILRKLFLKVEHISLVNLIAGKEVVKELVANKMNDEELYKETHLIISDNQHRDKILQGYRLMREKLGNDDAAKSAAKEIIEYTKSRKASR